MKMLQKQEFLKSVADIETEPARRRNSPFLTFCGIPASVNRQDAQHNPEATLQSGSARHHTSTHQPVVILTPAVILTLP